MSNKKYYLSTFYFLLSTFFLTSFLITFSYNAFAATEDYDQKMLGFSVSNFGEKNQKTWDLQGDTLNMVGSEIQLTNIKANIYGKQENMVLTADNGTFERNEGKVHLQDDVLIISDAGAKMTTDTLNWLQNSQTVYTDDQVNIYKGNMEAQGLGAVGKTDLKQFSLNKEVQVKINNESQGSASDSEGSGPKMKKTTITCDGPLDIDYQGQTAVFNNNVKADDGESRMSADKMTGYFDNTTKKIVKIIAEGNVKIERGQDVSYSQKAIYDTANQQISLLGRPQITFYSQQQKAGEEEKDKKE